ncbi:MAG: MFS transporter [Candidatus Izimaplasma sp.]|nr:MFS transporter [Candidatus Izimaplasma bacterium]
MKAIERNIPLDYAHTFVRNINFTHGIWVMYLLSKEFTLFDIGVFESVFHISSMVFEVPTGMIADLFGRKLSRILGVFVALMYITIMLVFDSYGMIVLAFTLLGLSYTFESGSGEALVYDSLKKLGKADEFIHFNGRKEVFYQLAMTLSLLIGGYIAMIRFELNFQLMFGIYVIAIVLLALMKDVTFQNLTNHSIVLRFKHHFIDSTKIVLSNKRLFFLILISALIAAPVTTIFFFAQDYLLELGYTRGMIGVFLAGHSLCAALGGFFAVKIEKKYREQKVLKYVPLFILGMFWFMIIPSTYVIPFVLIGFFDSVFYVVMADYVNKITPSDKRATVLSLGALTFSVVMIILFPLVGLFAEQTSFFYANIALASITTIVYGILLVILNTEHFNTYKL